MKIPLYNKGLGATGVTTGASLGPRATSEAFTGVGQGLAEFGRVANKVATDFFDAEAQSVADDANTKASLQYREKLNEFNRTNGSLSVAEYDAKFTKFKDVELKRVSGQYKLRKDHQQKLNNSLEIIAANGKEAGRQSSFIKGTKIRAQNAQDHISTIIDEYVITTEPGAKLKLKQKLEEQQKINLANGYTPYLEYKTTDDALKEADKRGLFIDINSDDNTIENLQAMQKEILNPKSEQYKSYSASERETFDSKIEQRINELRTGVTANLQQKSEKLLSFITVNPDKADKEIEKLGQGYELLGERGKALWLPIKEQLLVAKGIAEKTKPYELESASSMQSALIKQEAKWRSSNLEDSNKELEILKGMRTEFTNIQKNISSDPVLYIKAKLSYTGKKIDEGDLIATQKRMGIFDKKIRIKTNEEVRSLFNEYHSKKSGSEKSIFLKQTIDNAGDNAKYLMPQMFENGFTQFTNLSLIDENSALNSVYLDAEMRDRKTMEKIIGSTKVNEITNEVNLLFDDFRKSISGSSFQGSILSGNNRGGGAEGVLDSLIHTAIYIQQTNPGLSTMDAAKRAVSGIDSNYEMRRINNGVYRIPNKEVSSDDQAIVHDSLKRIVDNKDALEKIIEPPGDASFSTWHTQAKRGLQWVTNADETGVFLTNANAHGSFVINKNTGERVEYKFRDLITEKKEATETTEEIQKTNREKRLEDRQNQIDLRNNQPENQTILKQSKRFRREKE
jgi:hypothetical protein